MGTIFLLFSLFLKNFLYFFIDLGWVNWYDYGNQFFIYFFHFFKILFMFFHCFWHLPFGWVTWVWNFGFWKFVTCNFVNAKL